MNVYLIWEEGTTFYKIGKADNPLTRLKDLQTSHARTLTLVTSVAVGSNALKKEAILHAKYKEYRIKGEWFNFPDQLIDEVKFDLLNELQVSSENTPEKLENKKRLVRIAVNFDSENDKTVIQELNDMLENSGFNSYSHLIKVILADTLPLIKDHPRYSIKALQRCLGFDPE